MMVKIVKQNMPYIGKELWKLDKEIIKWPPYVNRIRKLLVETTNQMDRKNKKMIDI